MTDRTSYPAYYWRHKVRYVAWFCHAEDVERFFESGVEWETHVAIGTEPEPGMTYKDEGHLHCWADDCPALVAARDAAFEAHAEESLKLANEAFDAVIETWPKG